MAVSRPDDLKRGRHAGLQGVGHQVAVANVAGTLYAFGDTCTHLQCSLAEGDLEETTVTCRCHGSRFDVSSGAVLQGPAQEPVETYLTQVEDGTLKIRADSRSRVSP